MGRILILAFVAATLAGCVEGYKLVSPERTKVVNAFSVVPQTAWNRSIQGRIENWTLDGPELQELRFVAGLEDGDRLFPTRGFAEPAKEAPSFRDTMTPVEIAEFVAASYSQAGTHEFRTRDLRPAKFGPDDGFRFDFSFVTEGGLEWEGFAVGIVRNKRLYMAQFRAIRLHFFERDRDAVERLVGTIRWET